ncbi:MAG TPA: class I SAM-dependent rRNA methyltransferase [Candidatus Rifleibacterium sp.]|nr:class I SAM-dependent rRNA methyltransferase [Candidatus Rifleibacterium sp.]HPT46259.1 class I SAM-dependent rRNA methyltransferase [Candidatus Rifleibacterium sp.]
MQTVQLTLKKNKEFSLIKGHPWAYAEAFREIPPGIKTGDCIEVFSHRQQYLGLGYADIDSKILVRMLPISRDEKLEAGVIRLVKQAVAHRLEFFNNSDTNAFRLINGEGDGLPGLIADRYAGAISLQIYSLGLEQFVGPVLKAMCSSIDGIKWVWRRNQIRLAKTAAAELIFGSKMPEKIEFRENGLKFTTDLVNGQKTGFFLDQRDNRQLIRTVARNRSFLNLCGYTGAFTVAAIAGGARETVTVDLAKPALLEAEQILKLNGYLNNNHKMVAADMYDYLKSCRPGSFDLVVIDPPSMAKSRKDSEKAIRAYRRLNLDGVKVVKPGGMLFTASCTSQVSRSEFLEAVRDAVASAGRRAQIIHESFHAPDHPIALAHPEGQYLKGLLLKIY